MPTEACLEELETLTAIFLDEIIISDSQPDGGAVVSMVLYPATGDDEESRYVTLTLETELCCSYPKVPPKITFRNPRGLNDNMLDELLRDMQERCEERLESQMIYELIDMGKEFLTKNNRPASECPICLLSFTEFDVFFRSNCFHHFHSHCLGTYLKNLLVLPDPEYGQVAPKKPKPLTCPVCRDELEEDLDIDKLVSAPPPSEETESDVQDSTAILQVWEDKRESMKDMFEKQKSQGGIIDLTDKHKKLLVISSTRENSTEDQPVGAEACVSGSTASASAVQSEAASVLQAQNREQSHSSQKNGRPRQEKCNPLNPHQNGHRNRAAPTQQQNNLGGPPASTALNKGDSETENKANVKAPDDDRTRRGEGDCRRLKGGGHYNRRRHK